MDLGAYVMIDDLEEVMKANNIEIPRLRGLRYMAVEEPISKAAIEDHWEWIGVSRCEDYCRNGFHMNSNWITLSTYTDMVVDWHMIRDKNNHPIGIRWDRTHGKKRKMFKYAFRKAKERVIKQDEMFNKYCGRDDVLYIHARLGAGNWRYYDCDNIIKSQPWYLEHIYDSFDPTYCDIYAKIDPNTVKEKEHRND